MRRTARKNIGLNVVSLARWGEKVVYGWENLHVEENGIGK